MAAEKKFKTMEEIKARLALYKKHVHEIPAVTPKQMAETIQQNWATLAPLLVKHPIGDALNRLQYSKVRSEDQPDPKGENFIKYNTSHQYRIKENDFDLLMEMVLYYGYYDSTPISSGFRLGYGHSGEHQFGIDTHTSREDGKIRELNMRSIEHTVEELQELGTQLSQLLAH
jgi:hypothetical protein